MQRIQTTGLFKTLLTGPAGVLTMVTLMLLAGLLTVPWAQAPDPDLNNDGTVTGKDVSIVARCLGNNPYNKPNCEFNLADTDGDGDVDHTDLQFVVDHSTGVHGPFSGPDFHRLVKRYTRHTVRHEY